MRTYRTARVIRRPDRVPAALLLLVCVITGLNAPRALAGSREAGAPPSCPCVPLMIDTDMGRPVVYLINTETDALITVDLSKDARFPGGLPLHTLLTPDGTHAYVTMMGSEDSPLSIIASLDWPAGTAHLAITKVLSVEEAGAAPSMLTAAQVDARQAVVASLWVPRHQQLHGPTLLPTRSE